jgi:excisionase family DNA binding protein
VSALEPEDRLLTPREASAVLRLSPTAIAAHADAGRIKCVRTPGGQRRYPESAVNAAIAEDGSGR